jgi:hypothetical protein
MKRYGASMCFGILSMVLGLTTEAGCGGGGVVTVPPASKAPPGVTFEAGEFGQPCSGDVYTNAGTGWAFCDNDALWAYTTTDPGIDGYTEVSADAGSPPAQSGSGSWGIGSSGWGQ